MSVDISDRYPPVSDRVCCVGRAVPYRQGLDINDGRRAVEGETRPPGRKYLRRKFGAGLEVHKNESIFNDDTGEF